MMAELNCDLGESFGLYKLGDDAALMPHITQANIACEPSCWPAPTE